MPLAASLEIRKGQDQRDFVLPDAPVTIGRATDNQLVLSDPLVSRHHARLEWNAGALLLTDLGSSNATRLGDTQIEPRVGHVLKDGDVIHIGDFTLTLHLPRAEEQETLVPAAIEETLGPRQETLAMTPTVVPLLVVTTAAGTTEFRLERETLVLGRDPTSDIVVNDPVVSHRHAQFRRTDQGYEITDLGSTNGLSFQGERVPRKRLADGDVLWIAQAVSLAYRTTAEVIEAPGVTAKLDLRSRNSLSIGRGEQNDVVLDHPAVSRQHARIVRRGEDLLIEDAGSTNGTFIDGERVAPDQARILHAGDTLRVGPIKFVFSEQALEQMDESRDLRLDALHLNRVVGTANLLQDISLSILPHEFVAIVGVSGAGKSTLLNALNGFRPATQGSVLVNGTDLYRHFDAYRTSIGYVPQDDIIHKELPVYQALDYAARLRLPADTTAEEREKRLADVLNTLDLTERKDAPVHKLSGGQRKRVSIGVELLTRPALFFLDEATSGLDPGTEGQIMRLLRTLADQGHTVLLITHATKNVALCDQVAFLAKGGYLAYFGPPGQALEFFDVQDFDAIYDKLENESTPAAWGEKYRASPQYAKFVQGRLEDKYGVPVESPPATQARAPGRPPRRTVRGASALSQFAILSQRNLNILWRDRASLALMLLIAPLIGSLYFVLWKRGVFASQGGNAIQGLTMLFMTALICILVGAIASMRELVKETDIYRRERMVVLKLGPYILSKVWVGILLALYQASVFVLMMRLAVGWPGTFQAILATFLTLTLSLLSGMLLGLLISALSPNQNVAPLLLIVVLIPQFMFAGGILPLSTFGPAGQVISYVTSTRWGFEALVTISGLGRSVAQDPCWQMSKSDRDALTEQVKLERCTCMGPNVFGQCSFPGVRDLYVADVSVPEPVAPTKPGALPSQPPRPAMPASNSAEEQTRYQQDLQLYQQQMEQYQKDADAYAAAAVKYQDDMEIWRVHFQDWKEKRDKAIGEAEGLIKRMYDDYGGTFDVNLVTHWGVLSIIIAVSFGLILAVQRWKDVI